MTIDLSKVNLAVQLVLGSAARICALSAMSCSEINDSTMSHVSCHTLAAVQMGHGSFTCNPWIMLLYNFDQVIEC